MAAATYGVDWDSDDESEGGFTVQFSVDDDSDPDDNWRWRDGESWHVPEEYRCLWIGGEVDPHDEKYERLMGLLLHDKRRWETIYLTQEGRPSSAGFLSILQATFSKADALHLSDCMVDNASFACLNSGIMVNDGIKDVQIWASPVRPITGAQMIMLSQGLATTTTLETLGLPVDLTGPGVVRYLIAGLEANKSLKYLKLCWCKYPRDTLPKLISALHSHPKLRRLMLRTDELRDSQVQLSLQSLLSSDNCKLEDVDLMRPISHEQANASSRFSLGQFDNPNTPMKSLHLGRLDLEDSSLRQMLPSCRYIVELNLCGNKICDLEPLDFLLLGESCSLETLHLEENPITVDSARIFARKLPKMNVLRRLGLRESPFLEDQEFLEEFIDHANQNSSMEWLRIFTTYDKVTTLRPKLMYGPSLNRAGRRYLGHNPGNLPLKLLPTAFLRSREIYYFDPLGSPKVPDARLDGLDATFWLLRENSALHSHFV
ncbi:unnamed protein product [Cylindrotheca closterium]|uniref:Uncharacterized protein n=1 Tax=Cylindrotheca closterium TaxID=2856 RepID=A0AAD2FQB9_9STRA|nr:unnamed protein product [Cylindrotheca closterium]